MRTAPPPAVPKFEPMPVKPPPAPAKPKPAPSPEPEPPPPEEKPVEKPVEKTVTVIAHLRLQLANTFVLYANYLHYHWQTFGPLFRDLHLMFGEFGDAVHGTLDELAERMRMLGEDVDLIELRQFQEAASVTSASADQSMWEMVEQAHKNAQAVVNEMRAAAAQADKEGDPGSVDLFSKVVQIHEKQAWFLGQALKQKDGLV